MRNHLIGMILVAGLLAGPVRADNFLTRMFGAMMPGGSEKTLPDPEDPVDRLEVKELLVKLIDYEGQVVEVQFDNVFALRQVKNGYMAVISYEGVYLWDGILITIPNEGLDFFMVEAEHEGRRNKKVFVQVSQDGVPCRALGTSHRSSKEGMDKYRW